MERILVGIDPESASYWAGMHALNLARRINATVSFLLVLEAEAQGTTQSGGKKEAEPSVRKRLDPLIEEARSEGIVVDYYVSHGEYENELISFIQENKVTMLVLGSPAEQEAHMASFTAFLEKIRHRVDCRIEIVHEKNVTSHKGRKEDGNVAYVSADRRQ